MESRPDPLAPEGASRKSVLMDYAPPEAPGRDRVWLHLALFLLTFGAMLYVAVLPSIVGGVVLSAPLVGRAAAYAAGGWPVMLRDALLYAIPFLLFLTVHEFGHYIAARRHRIRVSLPYYIPLPFMFGTFGAVIRIREPIRRTRQLFDIGASGPLAGFVVAFAVVLLGTVLLPPVGYLLTIGDELHAQLAARYIVAGDFPSDALMAAVSRQASGSVLIFGDTPLFAALTSLGAYRVPGYEIMHYPLLLAGWLGLFFTALNLLPVGQLDGGHVIYALFGERVHRIVARVTTLVLILSGSIGYVREILPAAGSDWSTRGWIGSGAVLALVLFVYLRRFFGGDWRYALAGVPVLALLVAVVVWLAPGLAVHVGYTGWLVWSGLILFLIRMDHPPVLVREPLTPMRIALGWACIVIFVLCFSIQPLVVA